VKLIFNTEIKVYFETSEDINVNDSLQDIFGVSQEVEKLLGKSKKWFFTGYSRKDALKSIAFDEFGPTINAYDIVNKHYKKNKPLINESIWDGGGDGDACSIAHHMMSILNPKKGGLVIDIDEKVDDIEKMISIVKYLVGTRQKSYVTASSKGYRLHNRNVFPDRLSVGWMLFIPHIVLPDLIPQAAKVIPVMDEGKQKGTIIVSTEDVFDGENKEHVGKANDIEIKLLDLGFLPLMTEL
jgi:hypothetical protein